MRRLDDEEQQLATTITSPDVAQEAAKPKPATPEFDPSAIIDPPDPRLSEVLKEVMHIDAARLETFLAEAREKAGQLRAIMKLPAREPQAFREKLVLILELIRGIHARAERLPLPSVCERADRFAAALNGLRDKQTLSGNDFLPLAVKLDDLLSHLAILGEVVTRLRDWRVQNGDSGAPIDATQRSATATGTTIRQPLMRGAAPRQPPASTKAARLSDLSQESLDEMAEFLADMYSKRVSLVVVGLEDVPTHYRRSVEKILGQLIHNAIRHGVENPADRAVLDKPEVGTIAVQFARMRRGRLSTQRAGRRPRPRSRQDPRGGRAPGRADPRGRRQDRHAETRRASSSAPVSPPSVKVARAASAWTWCAISSPRPAGASASRRSPANTPASASPCRTRRKPPTPPSRKWGQPPFASKRGQASH